MAFWAYDRIIAVSHDEKRIFCEKLGYPESKLRVTNLAASSRFRTINDEARLQQVKCAYNLPDHFILFVGAIHPQKNLEGVIGGYYRARNQLTSKPKLVVVGERPAYVKGPYQRKILDLIENLDLASDVILPGHIGDDLPYVYSLADLLLFPTRFEGFPLVLLEAMACGLPVVSSNIGAVQEVTGDAAILVNPDNHDEISEEAVRILSSNQVRQSLIQKGLERSEVFSWERCARETIKVYEELVYA
jgi:glycosyltransferase involved in cell wall biosynthesis